MSLASANFDQFVTDPDRWLRAAGVTDLARGRTNLEKFLRSGLTIDLCESILIQLTQQLPQVSDADMALNNFERFVAASRSPLALAALFDREKTGIPVLLRIFASSQYLADLLIRDPEAYDALRMTEGQPITQAVLVDDLSNEMRSATETRQALAILRRFKHRETLRVAFGDLIAQQRLALVTEQISFVAQAICQCAYEFCDRHLKKKWGVPRDEHGNEVPFVIFALGKFGGTELNYSSDIDLIMAFGKSGQCDGPRGRSTQEFFEEMVRDFSKLLNESTNQGIAYRVDLRLRPEGSKGRVVNSRNSLLQYYEMKGRTWERQAWIKARPVAGDFALGNEILAAMNPWIYRSHLNRFEITGVKALKRQIEKRALVDGVAKRNIKTGHGGIRDIEFVIQFLQLLNGGRLPRVQTVNTLKAIEQLQLAGCLSLHEESLLAQNYIWLRRLEHRLQIMFDLQTHELPENDNELRKIAIRMGYANMFDHSALDQFRRDLLDVTGVNRRILDHLLHSAFSEEPDEEIPAIIDLIFGSEPTDEEMAAALADWRFEDRLSAAKNLMSCAVENIPFLSQNRCRHFFAAIAPKLLKEINETPQPDATLVALRSVSENLGAKGVLWELFATSNAALQLFVRMCAAAEYLTSILRNNPGMIDELVDALLMEELPSRSWLANYLSELMAGATQLDPIIHRFKQAQHLRVGIRDLVGQESTEQINLALSNIAEVCLETVSRFCYDAMVAKAGVPMIEGPEGRSLCEFGIVACGKLAGQEVNYQSDLDLIFVFSSEGSTIGSDPARQTSNQHFFSQWAADVTKRVTTSGSSGKLYDVDSRLRPSGKSGSLATSLDELRRYFESGDGQTWERLVLCKSRVVASSSPAFQQRLEQTLVKCIVAGGWRSGIAPEILAMRVRMQEDTGKKDLKRGEGGTVDVEFLTQLLQLRHLEANPNLRDANTLRSLQRQQTAGLIENNDLTRLVGNYRTLRQIESALRLTSLGLAHIDFAADAPLLRQVAYFLRREPEAVRAELSSVSTSNRELLLKYVAALTVQV
ncbi:MAG: bifunctional [glutamate--ammonia ligase]-adenylyl-L-tyrosine phosphorylase/[glutamate--ammonia-ligase] adenylyltransferase [Pirellulaceae bacterium]